MLAAGQRILIVLWVGSLWSVGYLAVPTLFTVLEDKSLAGQVAAQMFAIVGYLGLACGALVTAALIYNGTGWRKNIAAWLALAMWLLVAVSVFLLHPAMGELRAQGLVPGSDVRERFDLLHQIASSVYLMTSALGLGLVILDTRNTAATTPR